MEQNNSIITSSGIWLEGDPQQPPPPAERQQGRNADWISALQPGRHLHARQMGVACTDSRRNKTSCCFAKSGSTSAADHVEGRSQVPVTKVLPFVGHGDDVPVVELNPIRIATLLPLRRRRRLLRIPSNQSLIDVMIELFGSITNRHRLGVLPVAAREPDPVANVQRKKSPSHPCVGGIHSRILPRASWWSIARDWPVVSSLDRLAGPQFQSWYNAAAFVPVCFGFTASVRP